MKTSLLLCLFILSQIFVLGVLGCWNFPPKYYALLFPTEDHIAAAILEKVPLPKPINELTLSLWINQFSKYAARYNMYISFALPFKGEDNTIVFGNAGNKWGLYIHNVAIHFDYPVKLHQWVHYAVTWKSENGAVLFYINGKLIQSHLYSELKGKAWKEEGTLVLGQDQDTTCGGFDPRESYRGEMSEVNIWDRVLNETEVKKVFHSELEGNVVAWSETVWTLVNNVSITASTVHGLCHACASKEDRMLKEDTMINSTSLTEQPLPMR